jgi:hypothetical protein
MSARRSSIGHVQYSQGSSGWGRPGGLGPSAEPALTVPGIITILIWGVRVQRVEGIFDRAAQTEEADAKGKVF